MTWKLYFFSLILHDKPENNLDALFRAFYFKRIKQILKTPIWPKNYTFFHWFYMTSLRIIWMHFFPVEVHFPTWLVPKVWGLARMANQVIISQQMYVHCTFFIDILCMLWKKLVVTYLKRGPFELLEASDCKIRCFWWNCFTLHVWNCSFFNI